MQRFDVVRQLIFEHVRCGRENLRGLPCGNGDAGQSDIGAGHEDDNTTADAKRDDFAERGGAYKDIGTRAVDTARDQRVSGRRSRCNVAETDIKSVAQGAEKSESG